MSHLLHKIEQTMGETWLPRIYRQRVLKGRTRRYEFPQLTRNADPQIQHTLLGIELKAGRRRMLCPDLATARYLAVFARIRCRTVAISYDISKLSQLADTLESSWHHMLLLADDLAAGKSEAFRARLRTVLVGKVRDEIEQAGAGPALPQFKQSTRPKERPGGTNRQKGDNE